MLDSVVDEGADLRTRAFVGWTLPAGFGALVDGCLSLSGAYESDLLMDVGPRTVESLRREEVVLVVLLDEP